MPRWLLELDHDDDPRFEDGEVHSAIEHVTAEVREALLQMPARRESVGSTRSDMN
jgi:hypothetical protein